MPKSLVNQIQKKVRAFNLYKKKLGLAGTLLYSLRRVITPKGNLIPVRIQGGGKLYLRNGFYDTAIFSQIFIYEELNFSLPAPPQTILDCGANIGLATLYFKFKYPQARVICVEPEQSNFALLKKNTAAFPDVHLVKKGIWDKTCDLFLLDLGEGHASFRVTDVNPEKNVIGKIEAICIEDIIRKYDLGKVDLLKMDIEGSEYTCFRHNTPSWVNNTACIAIEIHEHMFPGCKGLINRSLHQFTHELNGEYHIYSKTAAN